jgi:hypothetical protein
MADMLQTTSLRDLVAEVQEEDAVLGPPEIAERLLDRHGSDLLALLSREQQVSLVAYGVRVWITTQRRRDSIGAVRMTVENASGQKESVLRIALAGHAYWSSVWFVAGTHKETRDLTVSDVRWLIADRRRRLAEAIAQVKWLQLVEEFARKHKVKTLGDLEQKGIDLPSIDVPDES